MSTIAGVLIGIAITVIILGYFTQTLYKCPECGFRADYDHIAEVSGEHPYCPQCGEHTREIGSKLDAWCHRIGEKSDLKTVEDAPQAGDDR